MTSTFARSKVDFVFGFGLYMAPSDMLLRIDQIIGYNNEIVIAKEGLRLGLNSSINDTDPEATPEAPKDLEKSGSSNANTGVLVKPQDQPQSRRRPPPLTREVQSALEDHEDEKGAVIVVGVSLGLMALWFLR